MFISFVCYWGFEELGFERVKILSVYFWSWKNKRIEFVENVTEGIHLIKMETKMGVSEGLRICGEGYLGDVNVLYLCLYSYGGSLVWM